MDAKLALPPIARKHRLCSLSLDDQWLRTEKQGSNKRLPRAAFDNIGFAPLQKRNTRIPAVAYGVICPLLYQHRCTYTSSQYTKSRRPNLKQTMACICFAFLAHESRDWRTRQAKQIQGIVCLRFGLPKTQNKRCPVFASLEAEQIQVIVCFKFGRPEFSTYICDLYMY